jgi:hypothetical protein
MHIGHEHVHVYEYFHIYLYLNAFFCRKHVLCAPFWIAGKWQHISFDLSHHFICQYVYGGACKGTSSLLPLDINIRLSRYIYVVSKDADLPCNLASTYTSSICHQIGQRSPTAARLEHLMSDQLLRARGQAAKRLLQVQHEPLWQQVLRRTRLHLVHSFQYKKIKWNAILPPVRNKCWWFSTNFMLSYTKSQHLLKFVLNHPTLISVWSEYQFCGLLIIFFYEKGNRARPLH